MVAGKQEDIHYPVLLFVMMFWLASTRIHLSVVEGIGRNGAWAFLAMCMLTLLPIGCTALISRTYPNESILSVQDKAIGKLLTSLSCLANGLLFLALGLYGTIMFGDLFARTLLYGDSRFLIAVEIVISTAAALFPVQTHARYAHVAVLTVLPLYVLVHVLALTSIQWSWIMPIFNRMDVTDPLEAFGGMMLVFSPIAAISLFPRNGNPIAFRSVAWVLLIVTLFGVSIFTLVIGTFGIHTAVEWTYPVHKAYQTVRVEHFFIERIIYVQMVLWKFLGCVACAFFIRTAAWGFATMLRRRLQMWWIMGTGFILILLEWNLDVPQFFREFAPWIGIYGACLLFGQPIWTFLILMLRGKA